MNSPSAPEIGRLSACLVLTTWDQAVGYGTVIRAAADVGIKTTADHA
ncbi:MULTISPECIES: hypothetical protein [unclassified Streptomyces]|jgi:hypothetical protein|nr:MULTISPECIES: hypothetical protein [unclassified Streptomyces]MCX4731152.1 hypothetical protein [Streptomyces sp. NBC_01363]MCX4846947.1 hypothetical protein [Streptomyces sp. NBC_00893]MYQ87625.1 hypothetical protein [Streptomyces sp. SID4936]SCE48727.1 hypothetical protein GA0115234_1094241 [Streptomyces sp. DvalAA-43]